MVRRRDIALTSATRERKVKAAQLRRAVSDLWQAPDYVEEDDGKGGKRLRDRIADRTARLFALLPAEWVLAAIAIQSSGSVKINVEMPEGDKEILDEE